MNEAYLLEWIQKAEEDFGAATGLIRRRVQPTPNVVCFLCQQCCEKYLKAFLVKHNLVFPKTHDLLELQKLCLTVDRTFEVINDLLNGLNPYSVEFRYPGESATLEEAREAVKMMKEIRRFVRVKLQLDKRL